MSSSNAKRRIRNIKIVNLIICFFSFYNTFDIIRYLSLTVLPLSNPVESFFFILSTIFPLILGTISIISLLLLRSLKYSGIILSQFLYWIILLISLYFAYLIHPIFLNFVWHVELIAWYIPMILFIVCTMGVFIPLIYRINAERDSFKIILKSKDLGDPIRICPLCSKIKKKGMCPNCGIID